MPNPEEYTIGWICALPTEHIAACLFLDEEYGQPDHIARGDNNAYVLGVMAGHKVVIAVLPHGEYGTTTAATVATDMVRSFPNVKVGLMVGVGGGAPTTSNDIRLGDVVVSSPKDGKGGVYQYDYGKNIQDHGYQPTRHLNQPPPVVLTAMALLVSEYRRKGNYIDTTVDAILEKNPRLKEEYSRPEVDVLYASKSVHPYEHDKKDCKGLCDTNPLNIVSRLPRKQYEDISAVHLGTIASGNSLMKNALTRDALASRGILCFEMEAAGLMNSFPCLIVRGICDYSDSHKNKRWQGYAAMTAAAYTKDLLKAMPPEKVESEKKLATVLESLHNQTASIQTILESNQHQQQARHLRTWLSPTDPSTNLEKALERRHRDTCRWLLDGDKYRSWRRTPSSFFWLHGLSGCGKTVLASAVIQQLQLEGSGSLVAYHYFDVNGGDKRNLSQMLRSLLYQLSSQHPEARLLLQALYDDCDMGAKEPTARQLSEQFKKILDQVAEVTVIVDALDESGSPDEIVSWLKSLYETDRNSLHLLVTSRKQGILDTAIDEWHKRDQLHAVQKKETNKDVANYIHGRLFGSDEFERWNSQEGLREHVKKAILRRAHGMFRLAACQLDDLKSCLDRPRLMRALDVLPKTLREIYARALNKLRSSDCYREALFMLQYVLWARKPPLFSEMIDAIAVRLNENPGFKQENRLFNLTDVITQCSSLLTPISLGPKREIHLAHSSVKEYLTSQYLDQPFRELFSEVHARSMIAKISMKYMLDIANLHYDLITSSGRSIDELITMSSSDMVLCGHSLGRMHISAQRAGGSPLVLMCDLEFPFLQSASDWASLAAVVEAADDDIPRLAMQLYRQEHLLRSFPQILRWGLGFVWHNGLYKPFSAKVDKHEPDPLTHACRWGLEIVAQNLLESDAHLTASSSLDRSLYAATLSGHCNVVRMLLSRGAAVNGCTAASPRSGSPPLDGPSMSDHVEVVSVLLRRGSRAELLKSENRNMIEQAIQLGHWEILQLLVDSCDYVPFHVLFTILSRKFVDDELVRLLCTKPIMPDNRISSDTFKVVVEDLMQRKQSGYARLLLEKAALIYIYSFKLSDHWPQLSEPSEQEDVKAIRTLLDRGVDFRELTAQCAMLINSYVS